MTKHIKSNPIIFYSELIIILFFYVFLKYGWTMEDIFNEYKFEKLC